MSYKFDPIVANRRTSGVSIVIIPENLEIDSVTRSAGGSLSPNLFVTSGSFILAEDSTGKYISCVTDGIVDVRGVDLGILLNNGRLSQIAGDLSADNDKDVNAASSFSWTGNILSISMTAGQKLRNFLVGKDTLSYSYPIEIQTEGSSVSLSMTVTGSPQIRWEWLNGDIDSGSSPGTKTFGDAETRQHTIYIASDDYDKITQISWASKSLSGTISKNLGMLSGLTILSFASNQLTGAIPVELGNLSSLKVLTLAGNQLTGSIPREFGNLASLTDLYLYNNDLSGSIPSELGSLCALAKLNLGGNSLSGSIPSELGSLCALEVMQLYSNDLSGSIPSEIGDITTLTKIQIHANDLSGVIPSELGDLENLIELFIYSNDFSETDLSNFVNVLWENRVTFGGNSCDIRIQDNNGLTATAIAQIEGTGDYAGDGLIDAGCSVTY